MMECGDISHVDEFMYEKTQVEWNIFRYSASNERFHQCRSPAFSFAGQSWYIYINLELNPYRIKFSLRNDFEREYPVTYSLSIKILPSNRGLCIAAVMEGDKKSTFELDEIMPEEVQENPAFETHVRLTCFLARKIIKSNEALKLLDLEKLSMNFKNLLDAEENCDVTLKVKGKEYKAHKVVLLARSSVFATALRQEQTDVITISDCEADTFKTFLKYLYSGKIEELSFRSALDLYHTSNKYNVQELKAFCIKYIMICLTVENICEAATFADTNNETKLFSTVQEFFNKNVADILLTPNWQDLIKLNTNIATKLLIEMPKTEYEDALSNLEQGKSSGNSQELFDNTFYDVPIQSLTVQNMCEMVCCVHLSDEPAFLSALQEFFNKNVNSILQASEWEHFVKMHTGLANKLLIGMPKKKYDDVSDESDCTSLRSLPSRALSPALSTES